MVDRAIIYLREKNGLPPFHDSLDEPPTTIFLQIRNMFE
jgi:hypothetical protein